MCLGTVGRVSEMLVKKIKKVHGKVGFGKERMCSYKHTHNSAVHIEQALIEIHGLGKNGGTLLNRINSISPTNPVYSSQLQRGYELLKSIGYSW